MTAAERDRLAGVIRGLRERLYYLTEHRRPHEREWETEARESQREEDNRESRAAWDAETERLIAGEEAQP